MLDLREFMRGKCSPEAAPRFPETVDFSKVLPHFATLHAGYGT